MIDTESGRGSLYADIIPGGYDVLELREPFSPMRYIEAIQAVEASGAQIGIIDSGSHEWEGIGGVQDMHDQTEQKSGKPGLHNWRGPKLEHAKFMLKLLQSPMPWIVCLRAKHKTRQGKNAQGRTEIVKDDFTSPIQSGDFIFEMTVHGEIMTDHTFRLTKCSHPDLRRCMPNNEMVAGTHGELVAKWCNAPAANGHKPADPVKAAKAELWEVLKDVRGAEKSWTAAEGWLLAKGIITDGESISKLTPERLTEISAVAREQLLNLPV